MKQVAYFQLWILPRFSIWSLGSYKKELIKGYVPRFWCTSQNAPFKSQENQGSLLGNKLFLIGRQMEDLCWTHSRISFWLLLDKVMLEPPKWLLYLIGTQQKQKQPQTWFCTATDPPRSCGSACVSLGRPVTPTFSKWPVLTDFCSFSSFSLYIGRISGKLKPKKWHFLWLGTLDFCFHLDFLTSLAKLP